MRLEGTLDAFSLPDIFQLLSFTKKTGALRLRRDAGGVVQQGVVHVRDGVVTAARSDVSRQQLARRLVSAGLVDDEALAAAAEKLAEDAAPSLVAALVEHGDLPGDAARVVAGDQVVDAVFDLLRWPDGEFAFVVDDLPGDDVGAELPVEELVAEGRRRLEAWPGIVEQVPAADAVLRLSPAAPGDLTMSADEWALLALADGRRTVRDLVVLAGRGEYAVVSGLAGLVGRRLLVVGQAGDDQPTRRHLLLSALEGVPVPEPTVAEPPVSVELAAVQEPDAPEEPAAPAVELVPEQPAAPALAPVAEPAQAAPRVPSPSRGDAPVIPSRPEPFTAPRRPDHPEEVPTLVSAAGAGHGSVNGATAMQPEATPAGLVERDPSVNKSLLLRLIAGVRGL